jgi:hypothetical protein
MSNFAWASQNFKGGGAKKNLGGVPPPVLPLCPCMEGLTFDDTFCNFCHFYKLSTLPHCTVPRSQKTRLKILPVLTRDSNNNNNNKVKSKPLELYELAGKNVAPRAEITLFFTRESALRVYFLLCCSCSC